MSTKIHVIPTFHHDIAYLQPEPVYTKWATDIVDKALSLMEQDETYTFTVEQAYFFKYYFETHPEKREAMAAFAKKGQLQFAPGVWSVPDMCMPHGESLFMQATLGKRLLNETVGADPKACFIADCWGHHAQLPQIMTQCGYDYYTFSRCMEKDFAVENFRWEGIDGTVMNTHWMSTAYAGISFPDDAKVVNAGELHWESASKEGFLKLYQRNKEHCKEEIQMMPAGGDMKMPAASALKIMKELQKDEELPPPAFSSFEQGLSQIDYNNTPIYKGEFISSLKGTFATNILIKQYNRQLEHLLYTLEVLAVSKGIQVDLTAGWELALKNQFHDILCGTICDEALTQVYAEYEQTLAALEETRRALSASGEEAYFNPLPFPATQLVMEETGAKLLTAQGFGYATETPLQTKEFALPGTFENDYYHAELDNRGFITKLVEKQTGKAVVENPAFPLGSLQLQADSGDNWVEFEYPWELDATLYTTNVPDPYDRTGLPTHPKVILSRCGVQQASAVKLGDEGIQITQTGCLQYWVTKVPFTTTITLSATSPRIDYHTEFDCNHRRLRLRVAFPHGVKGGKIRHQIPFAMVERGEGPQPAQYLMDVQNEDAGLSLINVGQPANNTEKGIMMLTLFRSVAMEYKCQSESSYNLGKHFACDYAIVPHKAGDDTLLWEQSLQKQSPMIATTK
ncbi:MAG: hypothetical protein IKM39_05160, partial [Clostridia bacterium]|nr:hypothetical protein [Clostridia bacterium]